MQIIKFVIYLIINPLTPLSLTAMPYSGVNSVNTRDLTPPFRRCVGWKVESETVFRV